MIVEFNVVRVKLKSVLMVTMLGVLNVASKRSFYFSGSGRNDIFDFLNWPDLFSYQIFTLTINYQKRFDIYTCADFTLC